MKDFENYKELFIISENIETFLVEMAASELEKTILKLKPDYIKNEQDYDLFIMAFTIGNLYGTGKIKNLNNIKEICQKIKNSLLSKFKSKSYSNGKSVHSAFSDNGKKINSNSFFSLSDKDAKTKEIDNLIKDIDV